MLISNSDMTLKCKTHCHASNILGSFPGLTKREQEIAGKYTLEQSTVLLQKIHIWHLAFTFS